MSPMGLASGSSTSPRRPSSNGGECGGNQATGAKRTGRARARGLGTRGLVTLEFAVVAPAFLTLLLGTFEFGRALWMQVSLRYAVQLAARCISVNTTLCGSASSTASYAASQVIGMTVPSTDFTVTTPSCGNQVAASVPFTFVVARMFSYSITLTASSCYPT